MDGCMDGRETWQPCSHTRKGLMDGWMAGLDLDEWMDGCETGQPCSHTRKGNPCGRDRWMDGWMDQQRSEKLSPVAIRISLAVTSLSSGFRALESRRKQTWPSSADKTQNLTSLLQNLELVATGGRHSDTHHHRTQ